MLRITTERLGWSAGQLRQRCIANHVTWWPIAHQMISHFVSLVWEKDFLFHSSFIQQKITVIVWVQYNSTFFPPQIKTKLAGRSFMLMSSDFLHTKAGCVLYWVSYSSIVTSELELYISFLFKDPTRIIKMYHMITINQVQVVFRLGYKFCQLDKSLSIRFSQYT